MPDWLTNATRALSRQTEDVPQEFRLTCECMEQHSGQRKARPQRIICQSCGAALFVLPKNIYPPPKARPPRKGHRSRVRTDGPPTGPGLPSAQNMAATVRRGMIGAAGGLGHGLASAGEALWRTTTSTVSASIRAVRDFFSPFRLVLAGIATMLLATAYLAIRSQARELARVRFREGLEAGQQALADDDLQAARSHFATAASAVETLGTSDIKSNLVRQLHHETNAMMSLAPGSLFEMLEDAERARDNVGLASWENLFRTRYEGTWFVLQGNIRRTASSFEIEFPFTIGEDRRQVTLIADVPNFERVDWEGGVAHVVFAAPVIGCELDHSNRAWTVTFDGQTGFLWSHLENLRRLGFLESSGIDDEELTGLLDAQTQLLEIHL